MINKKITQWKKEGDKQNLIEQIKSELRFLNCQGIKNCVIMADFGTCHMDCPTIENRKKKLKKQLKEDFAKNTKEENK